MQTVEKLMRVWEANGTFSPVRDFSYSRFLIKIFAQMLYRILWISMGKERNVKLNDQIIKEITTLL